VSSNPAQARCTQYNIMWKSFSETCGRSVVFSGYSGILHQLNWPPWYHWNIVDSGTKHHNPNPKRIIRCHFFHRTTLVFCWYWFCTNWSNVTSLNTTRNQTRTDRYLELHFLASQEQKLTMDYFTLLNTLSTISFISLDWK
jgi:hypothetical protein